MGEHMTLDPYDRERVCAVAVRLINLGWFRVGSERYAKTSRTYGDHDADRSATSRVRGNAGHLPLPRQAPDPGADDARRHGARRRDQGAARRSPAARGSSATAGRRVLQPHRRGLNDYIREHMGEEFTAKDFRTWGGTLTAAIALAEHGVAETEAEAKKRDRGRDAHGRRAARKHAGRCALVLRQPGGRRAVSRRANDRRFSTTAFARRQGARYRPRSGRAGALSLLRSWRIRRARAAA